VVPDGAVKERKKRVGQIEGQKGRKRQQGKGEDNSNLTQFLGVRLGRAATTHCFSGCKCGELRVEPTCLTWVSAPYVRLKRGKEG
jgi:hypothetical protein